MSIDPLGAATLTLSAPGVDNTLGSLSPAAPAGAAEAGRTNFAGLLGEMLSGLTGALRSGEAASLASLKGQIPVGQVVEAVMTAEQTLQGAIAVRDKVVAAYLELSRMQI
jgi:flagellar hook-basal body complex protein FliE